MLLPPVAAGVGARPLPPRRAPARSRRGPAALIVRERRSPGGHGRPAGAAAAVAAVDARRAVAVLRAGRPARQRARRRPFRARGGRAHLIDLRRPAGFSQPSLSSPLAGAARRSRYRRARPSRCRPAAAHPAAHGWTRDDVKLAEAMAETGRGADRVARLRRSAGGARAGSQRVRPLQGRGRGRHQPGDRPRPRARAVLAGGGRGTTTQPRPARAHVAPALAAAATPGTACPGTGWRIADGVEHRVARGRSPAAPSWCCWTTACWARTGSIRTWRWPGACAGCASERLDRHASLATGLRRDPQPPRHRASRSASGRWPSSPTRCARVAGAARYRPALRGTGGRTGEGALDDGHARAGGLRAGVRLGRAARRASPPSSRARRCCRGRTRRRPGCRCESGRPRCSGWRPSCGRPPAGWPTGETTYAEFATLAAELEAEQPVALRHLLEPRAGDRTRRRPRPST